MIDPRHDVFAEEEADGNEIMVEVVHTAGVLFDVAQYFPKDGQLGNICALTLLSHSLSIKNDNQRCHQQDVLLGLTWTITATVEIVNQLINC